MATGRTLEIFKRIYIDGYDMSGYAFSAGDVGVEYQEYGDAGTTPWADGVIGVLTGKPNVLLGPVNTTFDNTATSGAHVLANAAQGTKRNVLLAQGTRAIPAMGDDTFCGAFLQSAYQAVGSEILTATMRFGYDANSVINYDEFWGKLLHAWGSETGANSANTNVDNAAATAAGGYLMYQIYSITGAGTVTISVDDSANGSTWAALSTATTAAIATASAPTSGIVAMATTATVRQYLRWQIAFGSSATACTFALAFVRGRA